ncbi:STAS domain-containing protein [Actinoplanes sp. NPDC051346]|uniref:STAS domain-containing protein n=1 Tax=Actinoplanes sp. NPDC051346 TaxID=3155048 RepID=UPI00343D4C3C
MDVTIDSRAEATVRLAVTGEIDMATVDELARALHEAMTRPGVTEVVADLAAVTFCDSSGIAAFDRAYAEGQHRGIVFRISDPQPAVRRVLELTGMLDTLIGIEEPPG